MTEYDGATSLQKALEQLHGVKLSFNAMAKITGKYRERLNIPKGKPIGNAADKLKIYQWERDELDAQTNLTELPPIEPVTQSSLETLPTELNITQHDKFISINYRRANNSRHTVQIEQFYIDALIAIGITDTSKFVAENAGLTTVTKNVKRSIVNALVNRVAP